MRDLGELTLATVRIRGHGAGSDTPVDEALWSAAAWRDGKCVWWRNYGTETEALEAAGLRERAMSQNNVEVVKVAYEACGRGGLDRFMEHFTGDLDYRAVEGAPDDRGPIHGKEAMRA